MLEKILQSTSWALRRYFEADPQTYVGYKVPLQFFITNSINCITPTFFVVRKIKKLDFVVTDSYMIGEDFPPPDLIFECITSKIKAEELLTKADFYLTKIKAKEVFFFFPNAREHLVIKAFHYKKDKLTRIEQWAKCWHSSRLNLNFSTDNGQLCVYDVGAQLKLLTPIELIQYRFAQDD